MPGGSHQSQAAVLKRADPGSQTQSLKAPVDVREGGEDRWGCPELRDRNAAPTETVGRREQTHHQLVKKRPEPSTSMSGSRPGHPEDDAGSSANYKTSPKGAHVPKVPSPILTQIGNRSSSKAGGGYPL